MRRFSCPSCGAEVFFDSLECVSCGISLGYHPANAALSATDATVTCANREQIGCNWIVDDPAETLCLSCRHTTKIPDLSVNGNTERWGRIEDAKRRVFYSLLAFDLPFSTATAKGDERLHFEFLADVEHPDGTRGRIYTGHENGLVTLNVAEADDDARERNRIAFGESYRTLIGHLRHEVGHFYWDVLVREGGRLDDFRALFGDERLDYVTALQTHYDNGPNPGWQQTHVSAYATSHPWEDFAETFAHLLHTLDGLETGAAYGVISLGEGPVLNRRPLADLIPAWVDLTVAMNAINRSIGHRDFYPFVLTETTERKLDFVRALVAG